jgi:hypothetical protein
MCKVGNAAIFYDHRTNSYRKDVLKCFRVYRKCELRLFKRGIFPELIWVEASLDNWNGYGYENARVIGTEISEDLIKIFWDDGKLHGEVIVYPQNPNRTKLYVLAKPELLDQLAARETDIIQEPLV